MPLLVKGGHLRSEWRDYQGGSCVFLVETDKHGGRKKMIVLAFLIVSLIAVFAIDTVQKSRIL